MTLPHTLPKADQYGQKPFIRFDVSKFRFLLCNIRYPFGEASFVEKRISSGKYGGNFRSL
jgi:hypothetical protein